MDENNMAPAAETPEQEPVTDQDAAIDEAEPQKPTKDLLDKTWDFFASVPVATVLLFLIAVASVAGTLITQEGQYNDWRTPDQFYPLRYGETMGLFLYKTGMTRMYTSWWYLTLLFGLGMSLVVCSLERFVPLWRAVQRPNPTPPEVFVKRLKNQFEFSPSDRKAPLAALAAALKSRRYMVIEKDGRLYADKGRWGRWGPYITHIGLLLILIGAVVRVVPGWYLDTSVSIRDGATVQVPGADWSVRSDKFVVEYYESGQPKKYATNAVVIDGGKEVKQYTITMNYPLQYKGMELYQSSYRQEYGSARISLVEKATSKALGTLAIDLIQPKEQYEVAGYKMDLLQYFPNFAVDSAGKPTSNGSDVQNPGLQFKITAPDGKSFTTWFFLNYPDMHLTASDTAVKLAVVDTTDTATTILKVKKDVGLPVIYLGLFVVTLGVFATFYIAHKRYWALVDGGRVVVGGWTNRNRGGLVKEMADLATALDPKTNPKKDLWEGEER